MNLYVGHEVCVSNAFHTEANGLYKCSGMHCGKPAYRRDCGIMVLWICYATASEEWCLVKNSRGAQEILYSCVCRSGHAGLDHGKLPVGRWLGLDGDTLCQIAYEYKKKARWHRTICKCLFSYHRLRSCLHMHITGNRWLSVSVCV